MKLLIKLFKSLMNLFHNDINMLKASENLYERKCMSNPRENKNCMDFLYYKFNIINYKSFHEMWTKSRLTARIYY